MEMSYPCKELKAVMPGLTPARSSELKHGREQIGEDARNLERA
jgi:hypothetical protein